jgi:nucleotide-binding universal stress UspA family protein
LPEATSRSAHDVTIPAVKNAGRFGYAPIMSTILVPIDFSDGTPAVLEHAVTRARDCHADLVLLHAINSDVDFRSFPTFHNQTPQCEQRRARRRLNQFTVTVRRASVSVSNCAVRGDAVATILDAAKRLQPTFIVMGSHGYEPRSEIAFGPTVEGVLEEAPCAVEVVPTRNAQPRSLKDTLQYLANALSERKQSKKPCIPSREDSSVNSVKEQKVEPAVPAG